MSTIRPNADRTVTDAPGCVWALAGFFIVIGAIFVLGPLGVFTNNDEMASWELALSVVMGSVGVGVGVWILLRSPRVTTTVDVGRREVIVRTVGFGGASERRIDTTEIAALEIAEELDGDGDTTYQPRIVLRSGERVAISSVWRSVREPAERRSAGLRRALAEGFGMEISDRASDGGDRSALETGNR